MTATGYWKGQNAGVGAGITSNALTVATGDFITIAIVHEDWTDASAWTVSNNGTAIIWTDAGNTNNSGSNTEVRLFTGTAGATPPTTVTVTVTAGSAPTSSKGLFVGVHTGAHATTPLPAGNIFSGITATDVSQAITPTSSGSALWFVAGDWGETNSFAAIANCSLVAAAFDQAGRMTAVAIQPTTQPRTNAAAFTIGETDSSANRIAWMAWEVQSAAVVNKYLLVRN